MRKMLFLSWLLLALGGSSRAQLLPQSKILSSKGTKLSISDDFVPVPFNKQTLQLRLQLPNGSQQLKSFADFKLKEQSPATDEYGYQHYHYTQTINGIEVDGAEMRVHVKNGTVEDQNGSWLLDVPARLSTLRASQSAQTILGTVASSLKGEQISSHDLTATSASGRSNTDLPDDAKLVYVPMGRDLENINADSVRLAYRFTVSTGAFRRFMYYVDATNGELLYKINMVCRIMGNRQHQHTAACSPSTQQTAEPQATPLLAESNDPNSILYTMYSGSHKANTTKLSDKKWALKDLVRNINVVELDSLKIDKKGNEIIYDSDFLNSSNIWRAKSPTDLDAYAHDALWGAQQTYDFFKNTFKSWLYKTTLPRQKLQIYTNLDMKKIDPNSPNSVNAFYSGTELGLGKGSPENGIAPLSALDIVAHEVAHGITAGTSGLRYINESGAINESISDIFGTAVEHYQRPERKDWTIGEDIGFVLRSMSNPEIGEQPAEYGGKYFLNYTVNIDVDNGGIHINSGIMNRWFYLLCVGGKGTNQAGRSYDVQGIGMADAIKIVYLAQTDYITAGMSFYTASLATFRAARAIFGKDAKQTQQVENAWAAVNVLKSTLSNNCTDAHEPNNKSTQATAIKVDVPVQGNLEDFAKSEFNRGEMGLGIIANTDTEKYADWYTFTTTNAKPNIQLKLTNYFADVLTVTLYKDKVTEDNMQHSSASTGSYLYRTSSVDQKSLETTILLQPNNEVKGHRYYVKIAYGFDDGEKWQAISSLSNGCYEFVVSSSAKPFPIVDVIKRQESAIKQVLDRKFVHILNVNSSETKEYKLLSLPDDKQLQQGVRLTQRKYDRKADQIWQIVDYDINNGTTLVLKNLNTDKVLEYNNGSVYQSEYSKGRTNQKLSAVIFLSGLVNLSTNGKPFEDLSVSDTINNSAVTTRKVDCTDPPCSKQTWYFMEPDFLSEGEYIVRSKKDNNKVLNFNPAKKQLSTTSYTELPEQRWKLAFTNDGRYSMVNTATGLALNLPNANTADAANYDLVSPNKSQSTQNWKILPTGSANTYKIANTTNNKTLTSRTNQNPAQYGYTGSDFQVWTFDKVEKLKAGYYFMQNRATGLYVDVTASSKENGANLCSHPYRGSYNQLFYVQPQTDGSYIIEAVHSEKALSTNRQNTLFQPYQWETDAKKVNHRWQIVYTSNGYFKVISKFNGQALQAGKSASESGSKTPIVQNNYQLNNYYQQWNFRILGSVPESSIYKLAEEEQTTDAERTIEKLLLYPNPAQSEVTVSYILSEGEQAQLKIVDLLGAELSSHAITSSQTVIDVSKLNEGIYLLNLQSSLGKRLTKKLVIRK